MKSNFWWFLSCQTLVLVIPGEQTTSISNTVCVQVYILHCSTWIGLRSSFNDRAFSKMCVKVTTNLKSDMHFLVLVGTLTPSQINSGLVHILWQWAINIFVSHSNLHRISKSSNLFYRQNFFKKVQFFLQKHKLKHCL